MGWVEKDGKSEWENTQPYSKYNAKWAIDNLERVIDELRKSKGTKGLGDMIQAYLFDLKHETMQVSNLLAKFKFDILELDGKIYRYTDECSDVHREIMKGYGFKVPSHIELNGRILTLEFVDEDNGESE